MADERACDVTTLPQDAAMVTEQKPFGVVYYLADPRAPEVPRYVGQTVQPMSRRLHRHLADVARYPKLHRSAWIATLQRAGLVPTMQHVEACEDRASLDAAEVRWIATYRRSGFDLCNCTDGGGGLSGFVPSEETRRKLSAASRGRTLSPESRAKLSAAKKGIPKSPEHVAKMRAASLGKRLSPETRAKISRAHIGRESPWKGKTLPPATRLKMSAARKGHTTSDETRRKIGAANRGREQPRACDQTGRKRTPESRARMRAARLAYLEAHGTPDWVRERVSAGLKRGWAEGGRERTVSADTRRKISETKRRNHAQAMEAQIG